MTEILKKGALLKVESDIQNSILRFFQDAVEKKLFDAVMLPMKVPSGDSFAWIMIKDPEILKNAQPLAPNRTWAVVQAPSTRQRHRPVNAAYHIPGPSR